MGLGCNGVTIICADEMPGATFMDKFQSAIAAMPAAGGTIDLRGFTSPQTLTATVQEPQYTKVIWPAGLVSEAAGVSVITARGTHNTCDSYFKCYVDKANVGTDLSPVFYDRPFNASAQVNGSNEIDNIVSLASAPSGSAMNITAIDLHTTAPTFSVTAVSAAVNGLTTYTTSWAPATSQFQHYVGATFSGAGFSAGNLGGFFCDAWTSTTITCFNPSGVAQPAVTPAGTMTIQQTTYHGDFTNTGWSAPLPTSCAANACAGYEALIFGNTANTLGLNDGFFIIIASTGSTLVVNNASSAAETFPVTSGNRTTFMIAKLAGSAFLNGITQDGKVHDLLLYGTDLGITCQYQCTYNSYRDLNIESMSGAVYLSGVLDITFAGNNVLDGYLGNPYSYGLWLQAGFVETRGAELTMENTPISLWVEGSHNNFGSMYVENDNPAGTNLDQLMAQPTNFGTQNTFPMGQQIIDYSGPFANTNNYGDITTYQTVQQPPASVKVAGIVDPVGTAFATAYACTGATQYKYRTWALDFNGNATNYVESDVNNNATLGPTACPGSTPASNLIYTIGAWIGSTVGIHSWTICKYIGGSWKSLELARQQANWIDDGTGDAGAGACVLPTRNSTGDLSVAGQITSNVSTGTPPLAVASTTNVPNLNASSLNGATFANPGAIGSTPSSVAATELDIPGKLISATSPSISSGFGSGAAIGVPNGTGAFLVNAGTISGESSGVLTLPTAGNSWNCYVNNLTAKAAHRADQTVQTAGTNNSVTLENQTVSTGAAVAWTTGDILRISCFAY
jgi:hypothetical protein